jgi:hypothetical protein
LDEETEIEAPKLKAEDLAKKTQNPISDLISLPFQDNLSFGLGPEDREQNVLNIQPVIPLNLSEDWLLITRTIVPLIYQPDVTSKDSGKFGLGDINLSLFFSPQMEGKLIVGAGPVLVFPSATDESLGTEKWSAGPTAVVVYMTGPVVLGVLVNNVWSYAGDSDRDSVNQMLLQYFANYNLPGGWYLSSAPIMTANWKADSDNRWTVPVGGGVGKILRIGKLPINVGVQGFWNAIKPDIGPDWSLRFQIQFLFPK